MKYLVDNIKNYSDEKIKEIFTKIYPEKQKIINKYANKDDQKRSIISEYLLMQLFKDEGIDYSLKKIYINENGKPYTDDIYFNISHKDDYVCACLSNKEIGIDIEIIKEYNKNTLKVFALDDEIKDIKNNVDFYKLYTLKEAYIKMKGLNITNIKDVSFKLTDNIICSDINIDITVIQDNNYIISIIEKK